MLTTARLRLLLALLLVAIPVLYWGFSGSTLPQKTVHSITADGRIDFFMRDAQTQYWDKQGNTGREWQTPLLNHYPRRNSSELTTPVALMSASDGSTYKIRANEGKVPDDQTEIQLAGDVQVHHNPQSGPAGSLTTSVLTIYPKRDFAHTDAPVTLTNGTDRTTSDGLEVYFDERRIELLSNVRGQYHAP